jgi:hypothetical protein
MAVHTLTTAVDALIDRVVTLQPLAIAQVTANTVADKMWFWNSPSAPFWGNRPGGLREIRRGERWELTIISRLWLAHMASSTVGTTTPQDLAWQYIPETLTYFDAVKTTLAPSGYAELNYLAPEGLTITCPRGMDYMDYMGTSYEAIYIEFVLVMPFLLGFGV